MTRERLLSRLILEVAQAERSGSEHPRRESVRLRDTPPGRAMAEIAADCARALDELRPITERPDLPTASFGEKLGDAFSVLRDTVGDVLITRETSYRGTLLGLHHGVDAILLLRSTAEHAADVEIVEWCMRTLDRRRPLLDAALHELVWFGQNPDKALEPAKRTLFARGARVVAAGFGALGLGQRRV